MAFVRTGNRAFVYGRFFVAPKRSALRPSQSEARFALEILREFSSTEFVGKMYVNVGTWIPATWSALSQHRWYQQYEKFRGTPLASNLLQFEMDGSGVWSVQYLRDESDESGPYLAAALKFAN
jgi:hypothetical protein